MGCVYCLSFVDCLFEVCCLLFVDLHCLCVCCLLLVRWRVMFVVPRLFLVFFVAHCLLFGVFVRSLLLRVYCLLVAVLGFINVISRLCFFLWIVSLFLGCCLFYAIVLIIVACCLLCVACCVFVRCSMIVVCCLC